VLNAFGSEGRAASAPYLEAARGAANFIRTRMWNAADARLLRRFRDGHAEIDAYAEDYAYLIFGLLELFQADPSTRWLDWAVALQREQDRLFWDEAEGGWFSTTGHDPSVLVRMKEDYDGAEPTASSVSVLNLLTLTHLDAADAAAHQRIEKTLRFFGTRLQQVGRGVPMMAAALSTYLAGLQQVVITGDSPDALLRAAGTHYLPFTVLLAVTPDQQRELAARLPWLAAMTTVGGKPAAYVCRNFTCEQPVTTEQELETKIR
jgi:uncharacterized protein YyaL (SSP411 family)